MSKYALVSVFAAIVGCGDDPSIDREGRGPREVELVPAPYVRDPSPEGELEIPRSIALDDRDYVYVTDTKPARIVVFDSIGRFIRSIGRNGQGPGEFANPSVAASGSRVLVHDPELSRITMFDSTGRLLWARQGPCCRSSPPRFKKSGGFYAIESPAILGGGPQFNLLIGYDANGEPVDTIRVPGRDPRPVKSWTIVNRTFGTVWTVPFVGRTYFAISPGGTIVYGNSATYVLVEGSDAADTIRVVQREWSIVPIPDSVKVRAIEADIGSMVRGTSGMVDASVLRNAVRYADIPGAYPAFFGIGIDSCGRWWVLRSTGHAGGPTLFDVFGTDGSYLGSAKMAATILEAPRWAVGHHRLAAIVVGPDGAPSVEIVRIRGLDGTCVADVKGRQ